MNNVFVSFHMNQPAGRVWDLIGDPARIAEWHPALARSPREGDLRTCVLPDGVAIRERIEEEDAAARRYRYTMVESPFPVANYVATLQVKEDGPARCVVEWYSTFDAPAPATAQMVETVRGLYETGLGAVRQRLG